MSKYTTQLRFLCESLAGRTESAGYNSINEIIELARPKIFSFDYPIFDKNYKKELETKFIKRYYTREICAETFGRWQLFLESRLIEIMPFYNELYKSALMEYNIFDEVDYTRTGNRSGSESGTDENKSVTDSTSNTTTETTGSAHEEGESQTTGSTTEESSGESTKNGTFNEELTAWQKYSDTPQGSVQNIENDSYLTNATKTTEEREQRNSETATEGKESSGTSTQNTTNLADSTSSDNTQSNTTNQTETNVAGEHSKSTLEEYSERIRGKYPGKSYMQLIQEFRETILNIDKMILDDLSDLFMLVY